MLAAYRLRRFRFIRIRSVVENRELGTQEVASHLAEVAAAVLAYFILIHRYHVVRGGVSGTLLPRQQELIRR